MNPATPQNLNHAKPNPDISVPVPAPVFDLETQRELEQRIGYEFQNPSLLHEALTHASHADQRVDSNERMEFLGDAILGMIVCEHLFTAFPDLLEGEMTKIKSTVVSRRTCALVAASLGLTDALRLGKGMAKRSKIPSSIAAAVVESLVAAIYLDAGLEPASRFIVHHFAPFVAAAANSTHQSNYKSALQQFAQQHLADLPEHPTYVLVDEKGPDHAKAFAVAVEIHGQRFPECWANAKKEAEQLAARAALETIGLAIADADQPENPPAILEGLEAADIAEAFLGRLELDGLGKP